MPKDKGYPMGTDEFNKGFSDEQAGYGNKTVGSQGTGALGSGPSVKGVNNPRGIEPKSIGGVKRQSGMMYDHVEGKVGK